MSHQNYTKISSEDEEDPFYDTYSGSSSPSRIYQQSESHAVHTHSISIPATPLSPILSNCSPKIQPKVRRGSIIRESYNYDDDDDDDDDFEEEARIAKKYNRTNLHKKDYNDKNNNNISKFTLALYIILFIILISLIFGMIALNLSPSLGCLGSPYIYITHQENILKFSRDGCILHKKVLWGSNKYIENNINNNNSNNNSSSSNIPVSNSSSLPFSINQFTKRLMNSISSSFNLLPGYKAPLTLQGMALGTFNFKPALFVAESMTTPSSFSTFSSSESFSNLFSFFSNSEASSISSIPPYISSRINVYGDCFESTSLRPYLSTIISSNVNEGASLPYSLSFDNDGNFYSSFLYSDSVLKFSGNNNFSPAPVSENFQYISINSNRNFNFSSISTSISSPPVYIMNSFQNLVLNPIISEDSEDELQQIELKKRNLRWRDFKNLVKRRLKNLNPTLLNSTLHFNSHNSHNNSNSIYHIDFFPGTFVQFGLPIHPNISTENSFNNSTVTRYYNTSSTSLSNHFHSSGGIRSIAWTKNSTELWIAHEHLNLIVIVDKNSHFLDFLNIAAPRGLYYNQVDYPNHIFISTRMKLTDIYPPENNSTNEISNESNIQDSNFSFYSNLYAKKSLNFILNNFSQYIPRLLVNYLHKSLFSLVSNPSYTDLNDVNMQTSMNPKKKKIGIILKYDVNTRKIVHYYQSIGMKRPGSIISYNDILYVTDQTRNAVISFNISTTRVIQMVITPNNFEDEVIDHMILSPC